MRGLTSLQEQFQVMPFRGFRPHGVPADGQRMRIPPLALALACATAVSLLGPAGSASATTPLVMGAVSPTAVAESADYASDVLSDPWDFSNAADVAGPNGIAGGLLTYAPSARVQPTLVNSIASSQAWGRDGRIYPVDADRYTRLSLRLWSSDRSSGGVSWARCSWADTSCRGFYAFMMVPGWNTYDLVLQSSGLSSAPAPWSGNIIGLRLTGAGGPTVKVDWARLHDTAAPEVVVPWTDPSPGREAVVYWDADNDRSNNTVDQPGWGIAALVRPTSSSNSTTVPLGAYPPGAYRFYVVAGGDESATSDPVTVQARPRPVVSSPSAAQGADYATTVRKDPWDMAQKTDYTLTNARSLGANGQWFAAENTNNDPRVGLPVPSGFAGSVYHRAQIHVALLGAYGLANAPGGGCVGRLMWTTASGGVTKWQTTDDLVLYPGWNSVNLDLATAPSNAIVDPALGANRIGWAGQTITGVRFDPNEDPGKRQWYLDDLKISTDPSSSRGQFPVQFADTAGVPGTTARVEAVDAANHVLVVASGVAVQPGTNTVSWRPAHSVPVGTYRMRVILSNAAGSVTRWASAPLRMIPA